MTFVSRRVIVITTCVKSVLLESLYLRQCVWRASSVGTEHRPRNGRRACQPWEFDSPALRGSSTGKFDCHFLEWELIDWQYRSCIDTQRSTAYSLTSFSDGVQFSLVVQ